MDVPEVDPDHAAELLRAAIASPDGHDARHGFRTLPKMVHCGALLFDYARQSGEPAWFCNVEVSNAAQVYRYGGLVEIGMLWSRVFAVVERFLPVNAYAGRTDIGFAIHAFGTDTVAAMPAVLSQVLAELGRLPVRELEGHRVARVALICHAGYVEYPTDTGPLTGFDEAARLAGVAAVANLHSTGRSTQSQYTDELMASFLHSIEVEQRLGESIRTASFELVFQPLYELRSGRIVAVESLARWPGLDDVAGSTADYVELIEQHLDVEAFTRASFAKLVESFRRLRPLLDPDIRMTFNLSQAALRGMAEQCVSMIADGLATTDGLVDHLEVEVTESAYAIGPDGSAALGWLAAIKALGVQLAVDDFGSGYGAFSLLLSELPDSIKIDRELTTQLCLPGPRRDTLRAAVRAIAESGITVVCEGIETEAQQATVVGLGVQIGQGYLFNRPVPEATLRSMLMAGDV